MSAEIRQLKDDEANIIYPVTKASAVYIDSGVDTVGRILDDMMDRDTTIEFSAEKIVKTHGSGTVVTTQFMDNGSIVETTEKDGVTLEKKTTTFDKDGSIHIKIGD